MESKETNSLFKDLSSGFHIPGYSADVIDFPSSGTDEYSSSNSENEELCQDCYEDHDLFKDLSSGFHIPGYSADVIDFPSSVTDEFSSSDSDNEVQGQDLCKDLSHDDSENERQNQDLYKILSSGFHIPGYSADVIDFPSSGSDGSSSSDSDSEVQIENSCSKSVTELPFSGEKSEKYEQGGGDVFPGTSWQDSPKTKRPLTPTPVRGADFGDKSGREFGTQFASSSKSSESEKYQLGSWRVFADTDSLEMKLLKTGSALTDAPDEPQLSESSVRVKTKTVSESGKKLQINPKLQRNKEMFQGFVSEKMEGKTLYDIEPKSDKPQGFGILSGVGVLRDEKVVICDMFEHCLHVFSPEGHYITSHHLPGACDVAGTSDGGMVAVNRHTLYKLDKQGHVLWNVEKSQLQKSKYQVYDIFGVCVDSQGLIYTRLRHYVCVVDHDGHVLGHIEDNIPRARWAYSGIAVQPWGDILLPDPYNNYVVVLSESGEHKATLGGPHPEKGGLSYPRGIAVDSTGNVAVTSHYGHTVTKYSSTGECISTWGGEGKEPGKFAFPTGIAFSPSGDIIVCDKGNKRIQIFQSPNSQKPHQKQITPKQLLATDSPPHYSSPTEEPQKAPQRQTTPVHQLIN